MTEHLIYWHVIIEFPFAYKWLEYKYDTFPGNYMPLFLMLPEKNVTGFGHLPNRHHEDLIRAKYIILIDVES